MIALKPSDIPTQPGSYQFISDKNEILYVGKAKNLRSRIMSYFQNGPKHNIRIEQMLEIADRVEWIVVNNETESLLLEYSLIQQHKPRYNVQLKDDKSYPWLAITVSEEWPRAGVMRGKQKVGVKYFGPYTSAYLIRQTLDVLASIFPIRNCSQSKFNDYRRRGRGCLLYDIGKCSAPCINAVSKEEYDGYVISMIDFLNGNTTNVLTHVKHEMETAADDKQYERAALLRDRLQSLEAIVQRQLVYGSRRENLDAIGIATDNIEICVELFRVRHGRLLGSRRIIFEPQADIIDDPTIDQVLLRLYENQLPEVIPPFVYVEENTSDNAAFEELMMSQRKDKVSIRVPQKGSKKKLLDLAIANAQGHLNRRRESRINDVEQRTRALTLLKEQLQLSRVPLRIECFDISHIQGTNTVASMVVLDDGLTKKSDYRHFSIRHNQGNDDFLSMEEVITRRFAGFQLEDERFIRLPDLLLIDGGKGQVNAAMRALKSLGLENRFDVASLAKREEEVYKPGESKPYIIPRGSLSLMLLQVIRDEAHRFAITHHRNRRTKSMVSSALDDIQGLGPVRKKQLLQSFGSIKALKEQSLETLQSLTYLPDNVAVQLYSVLHPGEIGKSV